MSPRTHRDEKYLDARPVLGTGEEQMLKCSVPTPFVGQVAKRSSYLIELRVYSQVDGNE